MVGRDMEWQFSGARMRLIINIEKSRRIDAGIDLRCRQARMTEQFLNGPEIATATQKMCRKGVAQRMWSCSIGQTETRADLLHFALDDC